ncbi:vps901 [Candida oxycetoniae]|uniref:Vps901 n=1 Tax=Candida oxycetoniae TaxID=497107 RepID=A0AAI9WVP4_9ASCO|nr:vps901 [Candida oxycetoniae]KAI3402464.2 vps901 [Candida oxycetoniae]
MSFNNLAFNVSKSNPTTSTSTSNADTTATMSGTMASNESNVRSSPKPVSAPVIKKQNDESVMGETALAEPAGSSFGISRSRYNTKENSGSGVGAPSSSSKLTLSPTVAAPAVVTIDNHTKTLESATVNPSKTDLIGLFDKFDLKGTAELQEDLQSEESSDVAKEKEKEKEEEEEEEEHECKIEKMESDVDNESVAASNTTEEKRVKPKQTVEKVDSRAHLLMSIQPYNPPTYEMDLLQEEGEANGEGETREEGKVQEEEIINNMATGQANEVVKLQNGYSALPKDYSVPTSQDSSHNNIEGDLIQLDEDDSTAPITHDKWTQNKTLDEKINQKDSIDGCNQTSLKNGISAPAVASAGGAAAAASSSIRDVQNNSSSEASSSWENSKVPSASIEEKEMETDYKGIENTKPKHASIPEAVKKTSSSTKTPLNIKNKVSPIEQHQQSHKSFDFQTFLIQLRKKSADPIVRYLRSFLGSYIKQGPTLTSQQRITIIADFKVFISEKFKLYEPFKSMDSVDLENSREGLEKLIMNRLHDLCFPPEVLKHSLQRQIPKAYRDDLYQDKQFAMQLEKFSWINGLHFDIDMSQLSTVSVKEGQNFFDYAIIELNKINKYRAPRDKIICILNSCKIIFSYLKISNKETNADSFVPLLILVIFKAKTSHLISNIHYIESFRGEEWLLHGETSYYLSSIQGAINFIQNLSKEDITITQEEYDAHMEAWEADRKQIEKQERENMERLRQIELQREQAEEEEEEEDEEEEEEEVEARETKARQILEISPTRPRRLSYPQPRHVQSSNRLREDDGTLLSPVSGLSPSNVLASSAEIFSRSITNFLSLSPQPNETPNETSYSPERTQLQNGSPPPPALPHRNPSYNASNLLYNSESDQRIEADYSEMLYQPREPREDEINSEQMKNAYNILKEVFPTLDTNILKDVIFINKGDVDVCIDACLPLVDGQ